MWLTKHTGDSVTVCTLIVRVKGKDKFTLEQAMKVHRGSRSIVLLFL